MKRIFISSIQKMEVEKQPKNHIDLIEPVGHRNSSIHSKRIQGTTSNDLTGVDCIIKKYQRSRTPRLLGRRYSMIGKLSKREINYYKRIGTAYRSFANGNTLHSA